MALEIASCNDNHSIAYCLLGYLCAYYRYHHPIEFLTSFLNNAANNDDIRNGSEYAKKVKIKITTPKWGVSRGEYAFDREQNIIAQGLSSVKYIGEAVAEELYQLSKKRHYTSFMDLLRDLDRETGLNSRQLDILIRIDFFTQFGNQRELLRMVDLFGVFKSGEAKQIKRSDVDGTPLEPIVQKYAVGVTKSGGVAKSYTLLDVMSILRETEAYIRSLNMSDLDEMSKVRNFTEIMGYSGYTTGKESDRRKLEVTKVYPAKNNYTGTVFGYNIYTRSIGSGVEGRFTVKKSIFEKDPIQAGDLIYCRDFYRRNGYFNMTAYEKIR